MWYLNVSKLLLSKWLSNYGTNLNFKRKYRVLKGHLFALFFCWCNSYRTIYLAASRLVKFMTRCDFLCYETLQLKSTILLLNVQCIEHTYWALLCCNHPLFHLSRMMLCCLSKLILFFNISFCFPITIFLVCYAFFSVLSN